jgi:hypothetical protein
MPFHAKVLAKSAVAFADELVPADELVAADEAALT